MGRSYCVVVVASGVQLPYAKCASDTNARQVQKFQVVTLMDKSKYRKHSQMFKHYTTVFSHSCLLPLQLFQLRPTPLP